MNKWLNGKLVEMTEEEVAKVEARQAAIAEAKPSATERLEAIEEATAEIITLLNKWGLLNSGND